MFNNIPTLLHWSRMQSISAFQYLSPFDVLSVAVQTLAPLAHQVESDVAGFNSLQQLVMEYLQSNSTSPAMKM